MSMYKSSREDYANTKGIQRLGKLRWWFLILIIIGLAALVYLWLTKGGEAVQSIQSIGSLLSPISSAYAQTEAALPNNEFTPKVLIMAGIFLVLGVVYFAGIYKLFFSGNSDQIDTASDLVKTLTGFFVGAATGFLG